MEDFSGTKKTKMGEKKLQTTEEIFSLIALWNQQHRGTVDFLDNVEYEIGENLNASEKQQEILSLEQPDQQSAELRTQLKETLLRQLEDENAKTTCETDNLLHSEALRRQQWYSAFCDSGNILVEMKNDFHHEAIIFSNSTLNKEIRALNEKLDHPDRRLETQRENRREIETYLQQLNEAALHVGCHFQREICELEKEIAVSKHVCDKEQEEINKVCEEEAKLKNQSDLNSPN